VRVRWTTRGAWVLLLAGCGSSGGGEAAADAAVADAVVADAATDAAVDASGPCPAAERVGGFTVALDEGFTAVSGFVRDAVLPSDVWTVEAEAGDCRLRVGPVLQCDEACGADRTCAGERGCIDYPRNRSVGTVEITGLAAPVAMEPSAVGSYNFVGDLPHPGFTEGAAIHLEAAGGDFAPFALDGRGIAALEVPEGEVPASADRPLALRWTPPATPGPARVQVTVDIAHHGGTLAEIECDAPDTGALDIPASLVGQLIARGVAGFPAVTLTRRTVDSARIAPGCVDFTVASVVVRDVVIDGVRSCNFDEDCPDGQACAPELVCR
jgi:hypothetical protein